MQSLYCCQALKTDLQYVFNEEKQEKTVIVRAPAPVAIPSDFAQQNRRVFRYGSSRQIM